MDYCTFIYGFIHTHYRVCMHFLTDYKVANIHLSNHVKGKFQISINLPFLIPKLDFYRMLSD